MSKYKCTICREPQNHRGFCWECFTSKDEQMKKAVKNREYELEQKRKYLDSGVAVDSLDTLLEFKWFYWVYKNRPIHREALLSLQTRFLLYLIESKQITIAIKKYVVK